MKIRTIAEEENNKYRMIIYGESHNHPNEMREKIKKQNPNVVLHELDFEEKGKIKEYAPNATLKPLETDATRSKKFSEREKHMLTKIKENYNKNDNVAVVLGDTHIRTVDTEELGEKSPIYTFAKSKNDIKIIRTKHGEIS